MNVHINMHIAYVYFRQDIHKTKGKTSKILQFCFDTLMSVVVRALPVRLYRSQANRRGVVAELLLSIVMYMYRK